MARGQLGLERPAMRRCERLRDDVVRMLRELVGDLDSRSPRAEADQRVHEALQRVLRLDDLGRGPLLERVRLVVDDERR
jgi:hypothetical protein